MWILEQLFFSILSPGLFPSPWLCHPLSSLGPVQYRGLLCKPWLHSQSSKAKIRLICLSRAIRTSSLSFRNHTDHKLNIYLASVSQGTLRMESPISLALIWDGALLHLRTWSELCSWSVLRDELLHTTYSCQSSQICQSDYTWSHSLIGFCQNNLIFVANYQRTIGKKGKKNVSFCWLLLLLGLDKVLTDSWLPWLLIPW